MSDVISEISMCHL